MGTKILKYKENTKYLGLLLDHKLTWDCHVKELNKKVVKYMLIFSKIRHCLPLPCRHTVCSAFISSRLNYGSEIYVKTTKKFIQPLIITQNKILRTLQFKNIKTPVNSLYREFGVLKLRDLHDFNICSIVYKFIHFPHLLPEAINNIFFRNDQIHRYDTRHKKGSASCQNKNKTIWEKTVLFQGRNCWNKFPSDIKEIKSMRKTQTTYAQQLLKTTKSHNSPLLRPSPFILSLLPNDLC